jgi:hypothetical protein
MHGYPLVDFTLRKPNPDRNSCGYSLVLVDSQSKEIYYILKVDDGLLELREIN